MKRILAAVLLLCCLLLTLPTALAEPAEPEEEVLTEELPEEEKEESSIREADGPRPFKDSDSLQVSDGPAEEEAPVEEVDPLEGMTAFRRVEITAIVNERGEALVTQTINMNVSGILEDITFAFPGNARDREVVGWRTKSSSEDGLRYLTVHNKAGFSGEHTFTLSYSVKDLVSAGEESQKLELPLLVQQKYPVGLIALAVNLPKTFASMPVFSSGYYGDLVEDYMTISTSATAVTATVNDILQDSDSLTMSLTVPEDYFSGRFSTGGGGLLRVCAIVFAALALFFWWRGVKGAAIHGNPRPLPPDGVNPGDLPYLLAGGKADFNMLVSHWATLGYLSFYVNKAGHVVLRRRMLMGNERRKFEQRLFDLLFGEGDICDGASVRYQKVGRKAQEVIPRYWNRRLFDKSGMSPSLVRGLAHIACGFATAAAMDAVAPAKVHGLFILLGLVTGCVLSMLLRGAFGSFYLSDWVKTGLGAGCGLLMLILGGLGDATVIMAPVVLVSAFLAWRTVHGGRPSAYGQEVLNQTLGFRKFLKTANETHLLQMLQRDPQYFYKMLPYAQAMGLGNSFVNAFHDVRLETCHWYESARGVPANADAFYDRYLDALDMLNISIER